MAKLGLQHVVVTSVDRDDLPDGGAGHFAATIRALRAAAPATTIEVLTPDFLRKPGAMETVADARPDVYNHNLETVPRLYPTIRPGARYYQSLRSAPGEAARPTIFTKSGLMVGLGESRGEIMQVMDDLRVAGVDFLTIGQYLQPTVKHAAVDRFVTPEEFADYAALARAKGFLLVSATPLTRSSYHADADFAALRAAREAQPRADAPPDADPRRTPDHPLPAGPALRPGRRRGQVSAVPALVRRRPGAPPHRARIARRHDHRLRPVPRNLRHPRHARPAATVKVRYETGPFRYLNNEWNFLPHENGTEVAFFVDFEFRSRILQAAIGVVFNEAVRRMVGASRSGRATSMGRRSSAAASVAPETGTGAKTDGGKAAVLPTASMPSKSRFAH